MGFHFHSVKMKINTSIVWKGKVGEFKGWVKAMEDVYPKDIKLSDVIIDLKIKKLNKQIKFMRDKFGKNGKKAS